MIYSCGKCKKKFKVENQNLNVAFLFVSCPHCDSKNRIILDEYTALIQTEMPTELKGLESDKATSKMKGDISGWLVVKTEGVEAKNYPLKKGEYMVGRSHNTSGKRIVDISFSHLKHEDESLVEKVTREKNRHISGWTSRNHCVIEAGTGKNGRPEVAVKDTSSLNGTWLNNKRIGKEKVLLKDGDNLQLGYVKLRFKASDEVLRKTADVTKIIKKEDFSKTVILSTK
jgi:DNA-directed RNA polymerase subunit RPC12/RpoP